MFCPICRSKHLKKFHQRSFYFREVENYISRGINLQSAARWWYCPDCDHFTQDKAINPIELFNRYSSSVHQETTESLCAARTYQEMIRQFNLSFESLLDIGPGEGGFLHLLYQQNPNLYLAGIGPEARPYNLPEAIDWFNENLSLTLALPKSKKFHLIFFGTSLEHIANPEATIETVRRGQNNGDKLLVIFHDPNGWPQKIFGKYSPVWSEQHLNVFSQKSLEKLMRKCSYELLGNKAVLNKYPVSYLIRLLPWRMTRYLSQMIQGRFLDIVIPIHLGNRAMLFYAKDSNE